MTSNAHRHALSSRPSAHTRRWLIGIALMAAAAGLSPAARQAQQPTDVAVVITGDPGTPPRYAVPNFVALNPEATEIAQAIAPVLFADLEYERNFYMVPRDTYSSIPAARAIDQIPFSAWRELGVDAVVFGTVQRLGNNVVVQVRLFNVRTRQSVFGEEYTGSAANPRLFAHNASDAIHLQQGQLKGVARTKLAFVSDRLRERLTGTVQNRDAKEIFIADYDGANQRRVTVTRETNNGPAWSRDGQALAYTSYRRVPTGGQPDIFVSYIYKGLMENPTKSQGQNFTPAYSPDGTRIAFWSDRDGNPEIYAMNRDGSGVRRLTNHRAIDQAPTWSPSGAQIAFISDRLGTNQPQLYLMNADGTGQERLVVGDSYVDRPTWSPAPYNEIAFAARTPSGFDIKVLEMATKKVRQITFGEGSNESPSYSPNGRHIAFTSTRAGRTQIFTMDRNGKDVRPITREGANTYPAWSN